ncbi:hypothetical protein BDV34DRAFT_221686 [Aspergillus parasiticus]|uniref:Cyanovirin-N domain-containing protein n=1 Tax=Aspergillus parasiticus TaxID=5067 RepID=A0A5N6DVP1_ASPPA|nr:hypothetical protein BDV34DRAFT_221686 [Aspergillus parasiticus]
MRLLLPFIVLPLATLAAPSGIQDAAEVSQSIPGRIAAAALAEPYKQKGDFIRSCKDVKLDGKKDDMHELIATCAVGDGTEVTSKLDLSYCYSVLSDGGNNVNPKKPDDPTCSKWHRHVATITEKTPKTKVPTGLIPTNLQGAGFRQNRLSRGNEAKVAKTINVILYGNQDWIAIPTTSTGQLPSPQKPGLADDRPIIRRQPRGVVLGRDWFLRE